MTKSRFYRSGAWVLFVLWGCGPDSGGQTQKCDDASGSLPAVGSACASEGEVCQLAGGDPCAPEPFLACEGGKWAEKQGVPADDCGGTSLPTTGGTGTTTGTTTGTPTTTAGPTSGSTGGGVACDPNNLPEAGAPCDTEGEFCSQGACEDPCQFCNTLRCEGGVWTQLEAPPAPCASCEEICPPTVAAMCPAGPPDEPACVDGCMNIMGGRCGLAYSQVRACAGPAPTITCDVMGRPTVIGCESQFTDLYDCLGI